MSMNNLKIQRAQQVTDEVVAGWNEALQLLQTCWVNGAGVLCDPGNTRTKLYDAKCAIEKALGAMRHFSDWPRERDYD
ncbi:hypothetical protein [Bradyrhizobium viridifuturi]|uniref:hypothetical protein n=1 Tax=Bradyrhizobium viridifuturi TaxID=1654716 RepID=UPI000FE14591|nr:hypothetical protein [Bradyrhizobium viridifuturi]